MYVCERGCSQSSTALSILRGETTYRSSAVSVTSATTPQWSLGYGDPGPPMLHNSVQAGATTACW